MEGYNYLEISKLEEKAKELRRRVLKLSLETGEAHLGGSFSEIEILVALYDCILKKEDKFILSKGHSSYPLYILLQDKGYNPKISCHPDIDVVNGIWCTTGSLGHGLPIGAGMAFARKKQNRKGKIYVLVGDGECQEGVIWETMSFAADNCLDNLVAIVDSNGLQALDKIANVSPSENFGAKFKAFGSYVSEVNGHSFRELISELQKENYSKPRVIIANTIKGKGVSFMENEPKWHTRMPNEQELRQAYEELK